MFKDLRLTMLAVVVALGWWVAPAGAADRPNILVVVADDLGWADVGFHGSRIKTPHLDELARTGVVLNQHYVAPVCSPTRCALMTGRFGINSPEARRAMAWDTVTLAVAMKSAGYDTAMMGKWHLGSLPQWGPNKFGFDHSYGSLGGGCGPYDHRYKTGPFTHTWHRDYDLIEEQGHVTDLIAAEAIRWLEARGDRPFFLYVPFTAVHIPVAEPKQWMDYNSQIEDSSDRRYAACTSHMDDAFGKILAALARLGKRDNTLVIFFSDNGGSTGARNDDQKYPNPEQYDPGPCGGRNEPLRGKKGELYEGGIRVPALVHWPQRFKPGAFNVPIHVADWMPTLCGLVGYHATADLKWDGRDVWPLLEGRKPVGPRTLYWVGTSARSSAVRQGDWKLIVYRDKKLSDELFDLGRDPYEKANLAPRLPDRVAQLKQVLAEQAARDNDALVPDETRAMEQKQAPPKAIRSRR